MGRRGIVPLRMPAKLDSKLPKPCGLNAEESAIWDDLIGRIAAAAPQVSSLDLKALEKIVHLERQYAENRAELEKSGLLYKEPNGRIVDSPRLRIQADLIKQLFSLYGAFGLTPESRARLGVAAQSAASDPLEDVLQ